MSRDSAVNLDAALENSAEFVIDTFLQFIISSSSLFLSLRSTLDMNNGNTTMTNNYTDYLCCRMRSFFSNLETFEIFINQTEIYVSIINRYLDNSNITQNA